MEIRGGVFLVALASIAWSQTPVPSGKMTFLVIGQSGNSLPDWKVTSFVQTSLGQKDGDNLAGQFNGLTGALIPIGYYRYTLTGPAPGSRPDWTPKLTGSIDLYTYQRFKVLIATPEFLRGIGVTPVRSYGCILRAKIEGLRAQTENREPVRIQLHAVVPESFTEQHDLDIKVDPDGEFWICDKLSGLYVLTVLQGDEVLHVEPVYFNGFSFVTRSRSATDAKPLSIDVVQ